MKAKLFLGTLLALLTLGVLGGVAYAAAPLSRVRGLGRVTDVDIATGTLTVENRKGTFTILTNEETVYHIRGVESPSLQEIRVGNVVAGQVTKMENGTILAEVIAVVPPKALQPRGLGRVTAVDFATGTLTVENQKGSFTILTNEETVYHIRGVESPSLQEIQVGNVVAGQVTKMENGTILAKVIAVVPPKAAQPRGLGRVTSVDPNGATLTVENQKGSFTVHTDDGTVYHIRGVEEASLADVQVGSVVAGQVTKMEDGTILAKVIAVVPPKAAQPRGLGRVTAVDLDASTLTVENRQGTFTVHTDDGTVYHIRGVEEASLADVQVGSVVAGQVTKMEDGTILAEVIAVVPPKAAQPRGLGRVTSVDPNGATLTVENQKGSFTVLTNEETVYHIRGIASPSVADVHVGNVVAGRVERLDDGTVLAKVISVISPGPVQRP